MTRVRHRSITTLAVLGLPTLGLSLAITTISAMVPLLLRKYTASGTVAGSVVGGEGFMALVLPLLLGSLSDRTNTRLGSRLPYVLAAAPLCVLGVAATPFAGSLWGIAASVFVFYVGYYVFYPPYRALYPDLVPKDQLGRSQGVQTVFREVGLGLSLVAAPLLLGAWTALPFVVSAATVAACTVVFLVVMWGKARSIKPRPKHADDVSLWALVRDYPDVRKVLFANALWEFALAGLKTFVVLYIIVGAGRSKLLASAAMGIVAVVAAVAAPLAGIFADRFGTRRVVYVAFTVFGLGLLIPTFTSSLAVLLPALPIIGFGGAVAMTLPYALLAERLPSMSHGTGAGLYDFSRGVGVLLGPLVTGAAIDLSKGWLTQTKGYAAMWLVTGVAVLLSLPFLPSARRGASGSPPPRQPPRREDGETTSACSAAGAEAGS